MTLVQLRYFQALAGTLNYTRTAEALHLSQPSLSYAINELEKDLNMPLFTKQNRKITLTPGGELFLTYVNQVLSTLDEGIRMTQQLMSDPSGGTVTLGYFYSISSDIIPSVVGHFQQAFPDSNISFHFAQHMNRELLNELKAGRVDLAFCVTADNGVECAKIGEQPLYAIVPNGHRLMGRDSVSMEDLANEKMVVLHQQSGLRATVEDLFSQAGIPLHIAYETQECNSALQFVSIGGCVTIMPKLPAIQLQPITAIPLSDQKISRSLYLAWRKGEKLPAAVRKVRDFVLGPWQEIGK